MIMIVMTINCFYTNHSHGCEVAGIPPWYPSIRGFEWVSHGVDLSNGLGGALMMMMASLGPGPCLLLPCDLGRVCLGRSLV